MSTNILHGGRSGWTIAVVVPVYNEGATLEKVVDSCLEQEIPGAWIERLIIVDDGSDDTTWDVAKTLERRYPETVVLLQNRSNQGKGAALKKGIQHACSDVLIIQDADLEYDPTCFRSLVEPIFGGQADVVYGSRYTLRGQGEVLHFWHSMANRVITLLCNMVSDLHLTDMETGYKVFTRDVYEKLRLHEPRFAVEPEITIALAQSGCRVFEVPVRYSGRSYRDGKKLGWKDALSAVRAILYYGVLFRGSRLSLSGSETPLSGSSGVRPGAPKTDAHVVGERENPG